MWRCKKCGCENFENLNYCNNCGKPRNSGEFHIFTMRNALTLTCVLIFAVASVWCASHFIFSENIALPSPTIRDPLVLPTEGPQEEIHLSQIEVVAKTAAPIILVQPKGTTLTSNDSYTLSIIANSPDDGQLSYQWMYASQQSLDTANPIPGATNATYTVVHPLQTTYYWVQVWSTKDGIKSENVYSDSVQITVIIQSTPTPIPQPATIYGKAIKNEKENGMHYTFVQKLTFVTDSYQARINVDGTETDGKTNTGYSSKGYQNNKYGFYFADGDLYYAEAREDEGTVQLYYWDGQIIATRDYRSYETDLIAEGSHFDEIASEYAWLYSAASEMPFLS